MVVANAWARRALRDPSFIPEKARAIMFEIEQQYGETVYFQGRQLVKFGFTNNADDGVKTEIVRLPDGSPANQVYPTEATIDSISSDNPADEGKIVTFEGHYPQSGNLRFTPGQVTLGNQARIALPDSLSLIRGTRLGRPFLGGGGDLVGNVYLYSNSVAGGLSGGVPQNLNLGSVVCMIEAGRQQSRKGATSISGNQYWGIDHIQAALAASTGADVEAIFEIERRHISGSFTPVGLNIQLTSNTYPVLPPSEIVPRIIRPNSDVACTVISSANNTLAHMTMAGYLFTKDRSVLGAD